MEYFGETNISTRRPSVSARFFLPGSILFALLRRFRSTPVPINEIGEFSFSLGRQIIEGPLRGGKQSGDYGFVEGENEICAT